MTTRSRQSRFPLALKKLTFVGFFVYWAGIVRATTRSRYRALLEVGQLNFAVDVIRVLQNLFPEHEMIESQQQESVQFIQSLKRAGILIGNEREVIERLGEARDWHYAFTTLAKQGKALGIWFSATARTRSIQLQRLFTRYNFPGNAEATFEACLQG